MISIYRYFETSGATIHFVIGGDGPPLLLLHGCPQTYVMWHKIAPTLAQQFTIIASDLRGYGDSSKPQGMPDHTNYSFRAMARDQVEVMTILGYDRFMIAGHDRGARVTHRMALDHPEKLIKAALLDILPTVTLYENTTKRFATEYYEWFFFIQPYDFPERLLGAEPEAFLQRDLGALRETGVITSKAWNEYLRALKDPRAIHGMCEDYRAGASIDLEYDRVDIDRKIACPLLVLWGEHNPIWQEFDLLKVWQQQAENVVGKSLPCGHYLPEELPEETLKHLLTFFSN